MLAEAFAGPPPSRPVAPDAPVAVVAVAAGDGLADAFRSLGAQAIVRGGQSANPSTAELLRAIREVPSRQVVVLPNNPNTRLAAEQAAALSPDRHVVVVPTRNAAEGIAALMACDSARDAAANAGPMLDAARAVQTLQVTHAVRDARFGRRRVRSGQLIALGPDDGLVAAGRDRTAVALEAVGTLRPGFELVTLYQGADLSREDADGIAAALGAAYAGRRDPGGARRPALLRHPPRGRVAWWPARPPPRLASHPGRPPRWRAAACCRRRRPDAWPAWASTRSATCSSTCPRRYDDFTHPRSLRSLREDPPTEPVSSIVTVVEVHAEKTFRRRVEKTTARLRDASGEGEAVWFGRRFIERRLKAGDEIAVSGRVVVRGWLPQYQGPGLRAGRRGRPARGAHRARLPPDRGRDHGGPADGHAPGARRGRPRLPRLPGRPAPRRRRRRANRARCRCCPRPSSRPTTPTTSPPMPPPCTASRSTSSSPSRSAWWRATASGGAWPGPRGAGHDRRATTRPWPSSRTPSAHPCAPAATRRRPV